jgi:hypothetical protein
MECSLPETRKAAGVRHLVRAWTRGPEARGWGRDAVFVHTLIYSIRIGWAAGPEQRDGRHWEWDDGSPLSESSRAANPGPRSGDVA